MLSRAPAYLVLFALLCLTAGAGCIAEGFDGSNPFSGGGKADGFGECAYEEEFDEADPNDYLWTVKVAEVWTLPVFLGEAEVHFRRFAAGADPMQDDPVQTGEISTHRIGGQLSRPATLAEDITYDDLINGSFRFVTLRSTDKLAMTSCVKRLKVKEAVGSHNEILAEGYPTFDGSGPTNPDLYRDEVVAPTPGVFMLIDADANPEENKGCAIPDPTNEDEDRSVLNWLAVTIEGKPNPQVIDPVVQEGLDRINFDRGQEDGDYCQDSPWDWSWKIRAFGAKTRVSNRRDFPGEKSVKLEINGAFWQVWDDGREARSVQVDPERGELEAERGEIFSEWGGEEVTTLGLDELIDERGIEFRIRRDDWGEDLSYAECRAVLSLGDVEAAYKDKDRRVRLVKSVQEGDPAAHIRVQECTDGWLDGFGLHYLDLGIEAADRVSIHPEPPRPDLSGYEAEVPLRELTPGGEPVN